MMSALPCQRYVRFLVLFLCLMRVTAFLSLVSRSPGIHKGLVVQFKDNSFVSTKRPRFTTLYGSRGVTDRIKRTAARKALQPKTDATYKLIATNAVMFLVTEQFPSIRNKLMKVNSLVARGQIHRLLTSLFTHSDIRHASMNCYSIYNAGPQADKVFGTPLFVGTFLGSGILANLGTFALGLSPQTMGASTCVCGLTGAMASYLLRNRKDIGPGADDMLTGIAKSVGFSVVTDLISRNSGADSAGHMLGYLAGAGIERAFNPTLKEAHEKQKRQRILKEISDSNSSSSSSDKKKSNNKKSNTHNSKYTSE